MTFDEKYPLHAELKAREIERRSIANFLDWLDEQGLEICNLHEADHGDSEYHPDYISKEKRIGAFMEIDPQLLDDEKRAMIEEIRAA